MFKWRSKSSKIEKILKRLMHEGYVHGWSHTPGTNSVSVVFVARGQSRYVAEELEKHGCGGDVKIIELQGPVKVLHR